MLQPCTTRTRSERSRPNGNVNTREHVFDAIFLCRCMHETKLNGRARELTTSIRIGIISPSHRIHFYHPQRNRPRILSLSSSPPPLSLFLFLCSCGKCGDISITAQGIPNIMPARATLFMRPSAHRRGGEVARDEILGGQQFLILRH